MRVENGSGSVTPAIVRYSNGPSTTPIPGAKGLYSLIGSYSDGVRDMAVCRAFRAADYSPLAFQDLEPAQV